MGGRPLRVLHLVGSADDDLLGDLSRHYAADCLEATADPDRYEPVIAHVGPEGWRFPTGLDADALAAAGAVAPAEAVAVLASLRPDVVVPQMFCLSGMTHHRALFDLLGIPYVGNPPAVMALSADKARAKAVVAAAGVAVPAGEVLARGEGPTLDPPVVVKPVAGDNSVGMSLVRTAGDYPAALAAAWRHGPALVEQFVPPGREVRVATLERGGELSVLPPEEYAVDADRPVRDEASKFLRADDGSVRLTAKGGALAWIVDPGDPVVDVVADVARRAHVALGCRHYGLFDLRLDPEARPWFLEAGPYCSFATQSVVCTMARAAGIALPDLFASMVAEALGTPPAP